MTELLSNYELAQMKLNNGDSFIDAVNRAEVIAHNGKLLYHSPERALGYIELDQDKLPRWKKKDTVMLGHLEIGFENIFIEADEFKEKFGSSYDIAEITIKNRDGETITLEPRDYILKAQDFGKQEALEITDLENDLEIKYHLD